MGLFEILFGGGPKNKAHRGAYVDEKHLERVIERHTHPVTGEVKGIVKITEVGNPNNCVDIRGDDSDGRS